MNNLSDDDFIEYNGKLYRILYGEKPKIGGLVYVFKHNHPKCIGVWQVTKVGNSEYDDFTFFDVEGTEGSTYRDRLYVVEEAMEYLLHNRKN